LADAQNERFKIISQKSHSFNNDNLQLIDVTKDEDFGEDEVMKELMPMVRQHLQITEPERQDEFVYDIYSLDYESVISDELLNQKVGTLNVHFGLNMRYDEDYFDSDFDSEDSNGKT
jgi:hypothetical protein